MNKLQIFKIAMLSGLLLFNFGCKDSLHQSEWQTNGKTMGVNYSVQIAHCNKKQCNKDLASNISGRLQRLDAQYSHYRKDSELSKFNLLQSDEWFDASHEFLEIVQLASKVSKKSDGAFDITVGQAVNNWGFGPNDEKTRTKKTSLVDTPKNPGYEKLQIRSLPTALRKIDPEIKIDFSGIVKGYATDQIAYMLEFLGLNNYVIDIGGELRLSGYRNDQKLWQVGIETPDDNQKINFILTPGDNAVATSGDYRNFYLVDGKRISHTIDPKSGRPIIHSLSSVTVIDPLGANADAWATALMVMGPEKGFNFAQEMSLPALFLNRTKKGFDPLVTNEMRDYLLKP
ncbi:MAG: FAD:protein FMN transferase [Pseudomonadota bacterium]|nr:FAD:protein FMN transferase [Pseudomonadota bacterium]